MSPSISPAQKFYRNKMACIGLIWVIFCVCVSFMGYLILPDATQEANRQVTEYAQLAPGTTINYLEKKTFSQESWTWIFRGKKGNIWIPLENQTLNIQSDTLFYSKKNGGKEWILIPYLFFHIQESSDFSRLCMKESGKFYALQKGEIELETSEGIQKITLSSLQEKIKIQSFTYRLGSDIYGRDILSRLLLGTRSSLAIGFFSMLCSVVLGVILGTWAGWFHLWVEKILVWLMTVIWSVPTLLLAIAIAFVLGKGFFSLILAIGLTSWVDIARMVKTEVQKIKKHLFIEATYSLGFRDIHILWHHVLPNLVPILLILACANFASAILLEAGLSFLGLGIPAPSPTWGGMIHEGYSYIVMENGKWLAIFPGLAIILLVSSLNWVGNGLRDAWDIH